MQIGCCDYCSLDSFQTDSVISGTNGPASTERELKVSQFFHNTSVLLTRKVHSLKISGDVHPKIFGIH